MIALRMRQTPLKMSLKTATLGIKFKVSRPRGSLTLHKDVSKPAVFLAGGIGITPIRSIIHWATQEHLTQTIFVLFEPGVGRRSLSGRVRSLGEAKSFVHADSNCHPR
jgi:hypothetical protein